MSLVLVGRPGMFSNKSHLLPLAFVFTGPSFLQGWALYQGMLSLSQSGRRRRRQTRKQSKEGSRKEANGPKERVSFR
jgi:hypothetical protein